jgi:hypothetical protein
MKRQDSPLAFSPAPARGLEPPAPAKHHSLAKARRMERFLAAVRDGGEMGPLARWRVRPTADDEDEGTGQ